MRKREIPRPSPRMLALENALDQMPDPATMTPDEEHRALAILNRCSELATRRMVALHVKIWLDEHRDSLPSCSRNETA